MSVAAINLRTADGKVAHIMNNHDGHVGSTGKMLVSFYNSFDKVKALLMCGDIYTLEKNLPSKEFINTVKNEVKHEDISKVPANPYVLNHDDDLVDAVRNRAAMHYAGDYVACRFDLEETALPLFRITKENGEQCLTFEYNTNKECRVKAGFGIGEYTYLFDQMKNTWFLTDCNGKVLCTVESELKHLEPDWTPQNYINEHNKFIKKALNINNQLQQEYKKQHSKTVKTNNLHKPQSIREINSWIKRRNMADKLRVRTVQEAGFKYIAIQEMQSNGKWKSHLKFPDFNPNALIYYLKDSVTIDWNN